MDTFIQTIKDLQNDINNTTNSTSILVNSNIIQKQYLTYYVYRIMCHNFIFFKGLALSTRIGDINKKMGISSKLKYVCYPMSNRMTTDVKQLDDILKSILNLFTDANAKIIELKTKTPEETSETRELLEYLKGKNKKQVIKDIKELIKFVPNLSKHQYIT